MMSTKEDEIKTYGYTATITLKVTETEMAKDHDELKRRIKEKLAVKGYQDVRIQHISSKVLAVGEPTELEDIDVSAAVYQYFYGTSKP